MRFEMIERFIPLFADSIGFLLVKIREDGPTILSSFIQVILELDRLGKSDMIKHFTNLFGAVQKDDLWGAA